MRKGSDLDEDSCGPSCMRRRRRTSKKVEFSCRISGVCYFQKLNDYLRSTTMEGNVVVDPDAIFFSQLGKGHKLLNSFVIHRSDLPKYKYNSGSERLFLGIDFSILSNATKSSGRKSPIDIHKMEGDNELIISPTEGGSNRARVALKEIEFFSYSVDSFKRDDDSPNCTVASSELKKTFDAIIKSRPNTISIYLFNEGIEFDSDGDGSLLGQNCLYGEVDDEDEYEGVVNVHPSLFKKLSKICLISPPDGVIKFYYDENVGLKITNYIGSYGHQITIVRDLNAPPLFDSTE